MGAEKLAELYGIESKVAPFFPYLLRDCPEDEAPVYGIDVESQADWVRLALSPIVRICSHAGFRPLTVELSIIQDRRLLSRTEKPYFACYVGCFSEVDSGMSSGQTVLEAYNASLNRMGSMDSKTGQPPEPVIPHPELYEYAYISARANDLCNWQQSIHIPTANRHQSAVRRRYRYEPGSGQLSVEGQVQKFFATLIHELGNRSGLLKDAILLVVPFHRVPFPAVLSGLEPQNDTNGHLPDFTGPRCATPGGAVFVVLEPILLGATYDQQKIRNCARHIHWMLTTATLSESSDWISNQAAFVDTLGSAIHGALTSIRSIGTSDLCRTLSYNIPPKNCDDLRISMDDPQLAEGLTFALNRALLGEDTAAAMLGFVEMSLDRHCLRRKFQNEELVTISQLIEEAHLMFNRLALGSRSGTYASVDLSINEVGPSETSNVTWSIPIGYLDSRIIRGVLLEIFKNAGEHGLRVEGRVVLVGTLLPNPGGGVICRFSNSPKVGSSPDAFSQATGFLLRIGRALSLFQSLKLSCIAKKMEFAVELTLGTLNTEGDHVVGSIAPVFHKDKEII